jgi:hypothetical protein
MRDKFGSCRNHPNHSRPAVTTKPKPTKPHSQTSQPKTNQTRARTVPPQIWVDSTVEAPAVSRNDESPKSHTLAVTQPPGRVRGGCVMVVVVVCVGWGEEGVP